MNEFAAKKLGEVLAFAKVGTEILENGRKTLEGVFGRSSVEAITKTTEELNSSILLVAAKNSVGNAVNEKAVKTSGKLLEMQDLYLQDKWNDESELLEWLGFFEGAALVHWKLVEGVAQQTNDSGLSKVVQKGLALHQDFLFKIAEAIKRLGRSQAVEL